MSERRDLCLRPLEMPELAAIFREIAAARRKRILRKVFAVTASVALLILSSA